MDPQMLVPSLIFIGVLGIAFVVSSLTRRRPVAVRRRLVDHAVQVEVEAAHRLGRVQVLKDDTYSTVPILQAVLKRFKPARTAVGELQRASIQLSVLQYLFVRLLAGAGLFVVLWLATASPLVGGIGVFVGPLVPRIYLVVRARRRLKAFEAQLAETIDLLVSALRAGHGFLQALQATARDVDEPMRGELTRVIEEINVGVSASDAISAVTHRLDSYDFSLLSTAVTVQRSVGGNLAEVLESIANTVRERRRIRAEVRAITTGPRVSSYVLGIIPVGLLAFFSATNADYREVMFNSVLGKFMLVFAIIWSLTGMFLSSKVAKVEY
jgi:tight adherence protein B